LKAEKGSFEMFDWKTILEEMVVKGFFQLKLPQFKEIHGFSKVQQPPPNRDRK